MNKRNRSTEPEYQPEDPAATAAVLDPPESGPPTAQELGQADDDNREVVAAIAAAITVAGEAIAAQVNPVTPTAPDCSTIVAGLDRQVAPAWPASSPFKVDWPWGDEPDPVPGDIVGWNWQKCQVAVVKAVPPVTEPWPYTLTCEIRPMPENIVVGKVRILDLQNGGEIKAVCWYTRWNRAYVRADLTDPTKGLEIAGSGWLAVVQE